MPTVDILLENHGWTIEDLAEKAGIPAQRIEAIALGRWTPSPEDRVLIAEAFGLSVSQVVWGHTMDPRNVRYRQFGLKEDINRNRNHSDC